MRPRHRPFIILVLLACLLGLFVWYGAVPSDPAMNAFPDTDEVGPTPDAFIGQQVEIGGTVIATDPVVIELAYGLDETRKLTLTNVDQDIAAGQHVSAFGTLTDESTLDTDRALVRWPWEGWYMYTVSILAALWLAGRIYTHWTIDHASLVLAPRGERDG